MEENVFVSRREVERRSVDRLKSTDLRKRFEMVWMLGFGTGMLGGMALGVILAIVITTTK